MEKSPKKKKSLGRRIAKWSGITLLVLILVAIALPFIFKGKIIQYAKDEIAKKLDANIMFGDFDLSFISTFPDFRLTINNLKVVGKGAFAKDTLADLPELKLNLDLMSVIGGDQYKINSISLEKPRILARVLANGKANWDIVKSEPSTKDAAPTEATKFKLSLKKLSITNAHIVYDDASMDFYTLLDDMTYSLDGDFTQDDFLMNNDLSIERFTLSFGGMTYLNKVKTIAKADLDMDMVNWKFTFKENEFDLNELGIGLDGFFAMPGEDYNMDLKFKAKQSEFKNFLSLIPGAYTKDFSAVKASGKLAFDGFIKGLYSEKHNSMPGYGLNFQITDGSVQYPSLPKSVSAINIDCKIDDASGVPDQTIIDLKKCHIDLGGNPVDVGLHVSTPVSDANMDGWLKCKLDLSTMKEVMPMENGDELNGKINADVKMKGRMSQIEKSEYDKFDCSGTIGILNMIYKTKDLPYDINIEGMDMSFTPQYVSMSKFDGKIGKNDMHADGRIDNLMTYIFKDSLLRGAFTMNSSLMDLNQFMGDETASSTPDTSAMVVIEVPGNIDFTLNSIIKKLVYTDINMDNVSGVVVLKNKMVDISNLKMNLMGGSMILNGNYSTADLTVPKVNFDLNITDFDIQQTFKTFNTVQKLAPVSKYSKGKFSTKMNYTSDLAQNMMPIMTTVNGKGTLSTKQVEIDGFEPLKKLDEALKLNKFKKVTLSDIKQVNFKIENGRVSTEPFDFGVGKSNGKMGGSTGVDQTINYVMDMAIPRDEFGPANSALNSMVSSATAKGFPVKLGDVVNVQALFGGTVMNPTVTTNLKEAGVNMAEQIKNTLVDTAKAIITHVIDDSKEKACAEAQQKLDEAKRQSEIAKTASYKAADDALKLANDNATKLENSSNNPIQEIANKKLADAARKKASEEHVQAKAKADKTQQDAIAKAQADHDAKCK